MQRHVLSVTFQALKKKIMPCNMLRYPIEIAIDVAVVGEKGEEVGLAKLHWRRWQTLGKYRSFTVCTNQGPKENNSQLTQVGESKMLRPKPCQTLYQFDHSIMRTLSFCFSTDLHLVKPSRLHAIVVSAAPCIGLQKGWLQQSQWSLRHLPGNVGHRFRTQVFGDKH